MSQFVTRICRLQHQRITAHSILRITNTPCSGEPVTWTLPAFSKKMLKEFVENFSKGIELS